jgi:MFS family permease
MAAIVDQAGPDSGGLDAVELRGGKYMITCIKGYSLCLVVCIDHSGGHDGPKHRTRFRHLEPGSSVGSFRIWSILRMVSTISDYCIVNGILSGSALLVAGRLADIYGRRSLFVGGLVLYILCSIASPFIHVSKSCESASDLKDWVALCVVRAIAGLGLAIVSPAGFGITANTFPTEPGRTIAFSALAMGNPLGAMGGTLIGGGIASAGG